MALFLKKVSSCLSTGMESTNIGLAVNEGKTKYTLLTSRDVRRIDSQITADDYTSGTVKAFVYLGSTVKNYVGLAIKLLPADATMVSMGNLVTETTLVRRN